MESLPDLLDKLQASVDDYRASVDRMSAMFTVQLGALWEDAAERRDELHAVANRVESLTRGLTTDPAETAAKMVEVRPGVWMRDVGH